MDNVAGLPLTDPVCRDAIAQSYLIYCLASRPNGSHYNGIPELETCDWLDPDAVSFEICGQTPGSDDESFDLLILGDGTQCEMQSRFSAIADTVGRMGTNAELCGPGET